MRSFEAFGSYLLSDNPRHCFVSREEQFPIVFVCVCLLLFVSKYVLLSITYFMSASASYLLMIEEGCVGSRLRWDFDTSSKTRGIYTTRPLLILRIEFLLTISQLICSSITFRIYLSLSDMRMEFEYWIPTKKVLIQCAAASISIEESAQSCPEEGTFVYLLCSGWLVAVEVGRFALLYFTTYSNNRVVSIYQIHYEVRSCSNILPIAIVLGLCWHYK